MKDLLLWALLSLPIAQSAFAQENVVMKKYAGMIKADELKDNLTILASDALEGRHTGSRGQKMAAAFIAHHFQEAGLEAPVNGSHYQPVLLYSVKPGDSYLTVGNTRHENFGDMFYVGDDATGTEVKTEIVFGGLGRDEDFMQVNIKGKAALLLMEKLSFSSMRLMRTTVAKAREKGAQYVFIVPSSSAEEFDQTASRIRNRLTQGDLSLDKPESEGSSGGVFYVKQSVAEKIFGMSVDKLKSATYANASKKQLQKIKPGAVSFQTTVSTSIVRSENILGYLPGTDKKDELIIMTAHFDHIGKRTGDGDIINNGADDDGSGTVAIMQLAKAFSQAKKDGAGARRSLLFMALTGEEEGLLGSAYYVANPIFPLANTVLDLNMDMIGRTDEKYRNNKNYVYVIGADKLSSELHELNEKTNKTNTQLTFDYTYNDQSHPERLYYRSDHWNFAKNNIPIIFFFDGIHEDYHKVSDEVDKIDFELLALRAQCIFNVAWEVANRDERLKLDK
jgi:Peptidase family M28